MARDMRSDALSRVAGQGIKGRVWIIKSLTLCCGIATPPFSLAFGSR